MSLKATTLLRPATRSIMPPVISRRYAGGGPEYNPPTGYLFGEKPPPPGQKRKREDWELPYYIGMGGTVLLGIIGYNYRPDSSIQKWAMEEAKKRMEARGDLPKYVPSQPYLSDGSEYSPEEK